MTERFVISKYNGYDYTPVSVHKDLKSAIAGVKFLGGSVANLSRYPNKDTYTILPVDSCE